MSVVVMSSLSFSLGEEIARKAAERLDYAYVAEEVLREASGRSGIPEAQLRAALQDPPSLLGMSEATRKRRVAHVQAALYGYLLKNNVLYHSESVASVSKGVSHVLAVRVQARLEDRVTRKAKQDGVGEAAGRKALLREDKARLALAKLLFRAQDDDPGRFDLVIDSSEVGVDRAAEMIVETLNNKRYQPMTYSIRCMADLELSHRVRASLVDFDPQIEVEAAGGNVRVRTKTVGGRANKRVEEIRQRAAKLEGVKSVEVESVGDVFSRNSDVFR
jgi:cytidylate kinase